MEPPLLKKLEDLKSTLKDIGKSAIAFSGGVDSTLLLKTARMVLGDDVLAVYGNSVLQKTGNETMVRYLADSIGVKLLVRQYFPLSWPEFVVNPRDRCYHCKKRIYTDFLEIIPSGYSLLDASHLDDLSQERPGMKAIRELGIKNPLIDTSLNKREIRQLARNLELANWQSHSESCLATRIKTGKKITENELELIARGENFLSELGFSGCRVSYDKSNVFISLVDNDFFKVSDLAMRDKIGNFFLSLNYQQVFLNLSGRPNIEV